MKQRRCAWMLLCVLTACSACGPPAGNSGGSGAVSLNAKPATSALAEVRRGFKTNLIKEGESYGPADEPPPGVLDLIRYKSPVGDLAAYVTPDPGDGERRPAILWITGGDNNTIGDVWSPADRGNDQSARAFREAGVVMMYPSQRGGNDNPGRREGFLGEVDDVLAAADHLEGLPHVDPEQVYLGGHSTGGTLAMLVGECSDRFAAVFSLGPVASPVQYGETYGYHDQSVVEENNIRAPYLWLDEVRSPMFVIEGDSGNWEGAIELMAEDNKNPLIKFFRVPGHNHFTVIAPVVELLAEQVVKGRVDLTEAMLRDLK